MPAVLLCSYSWQQDAQRVSIPKSSSTDHAQKVKDELPLKDLLINELARLHKNDNKGEERLRSEIGKPVWIITLCVRLAGMIEGV